MNKKILIIAITCFSCLFLITGFAVADKPEWADKAEWVGKKQAERKLKKPDRKAHRESKRATKKIKREKIRAIVMMIKNKHPLI